MATSKANLKQTAVNAATSLVAAYASAGLVSGVEQARAEFDAEVDRVFTALVAEYDEAADAPRPRSGGGGGGRSSGGGGSSITVETARDTVLNYGKFAGVKLGVVFDMDGDATSEYGYGEGDKTGRDYVKWLAGNKENQFLQRRAKVLLGE